MCLGSFPNLSHWRKYHWTRCQSHSDSSSIANWLSALLESRLQLSSWPEPKINSISFSTSGFLSCHLSTSLPSCIFVWKLMPVMKKDLTTLEVFRHISSQACAIIRWLLGAGSFFHFSISPFSVSECTALLPLCLFKQFSNISSGYQVWQPYGYAFGEIWQWLCQWGGYEGCRGTAWTS